MKQTYANELGLCIVSPKFENIITLGTQKGEIAIWTVANDKYKIINAHTTNIIAIAISSDGKYVATASETGTLIRVFNVETSELEYELRRGSQSANIYDICFNHDTTLVACCSNNGTVHVFELNSDINSTKNTTSMLSGFKNYLPKYFSSQWGFKQVTINSTAKTICTFDKQNNLHIVSFDGNYFKISCNSNKFDTISPGKLFTNDE